VAAVVITIVLDLEELHILEVLHQQDIHKVDTLRIITKVMQHRVQAAQAGISVDIEVQMEDLVL
tara:strand:+ start:317 stop:508 length:192 start_codon:yes stop_codon:yes gene_type:complete